MRNPYNHEKREQMIRRLVRLMGCNPDCEKTMERLSILYNFLTYKELVRTLIIQDYQKGVRGIVLQDRYGLTGKEIYNLRHSIKEDCEE